MTHPELNKLGLQRVERIDLLRNGRVKPIFPFRLATRTQFPVARITPDCAIQ